MSTGPDYWRNPAEARERAEELRIALEQYTRKEISLKKVLEILRPEIERMQQASTAAGDPSSQTIQEQADAFTGSRLKSDSQVLSMLRACLNDAEQAAGMWDRKRP